MVCSQHWLLEQKNMNFPALNTQDPDPQYLAAEKARCYVIVCHMHMHPRIWLQLAGLQTGKYTPVSPAATYIEWIKSMIQEPAFSMEGDLKYFLCSLRGYFDGLERERRNSIANTLELSPSCTNLLISNILGSLQPCFQFQCHSYTESVQARGPAGSRAVGKAAV